MVFQRGQQMWKNCIILILNRFALVYQNKHIHFFLKILRLNWFSYLTILKGEQSQSSGYLRRINKISQKKTSKLPHHSFVT